MYPAGVPSNLKRRLEEQRIVPIQLGLLIIIVSYMITMTELIGRAVII